MPNIKFSYRYRSASNYKNFGYVIFANPAGINLSDLEKTIREKLIDETYFYASQWKLPSLFFKDCDLESDPTWHEFEGVEFSGEAINTTVSLIEILNSLKS